MQTASSNRRRVLEFVLLTAGVYISYIAYSIYQEKLFNHLYVGKNDAKTQKFKYVSVTVFLPAFCCFVVGKLRSALSGEGPSKLPYKEQGILGGVYFLMLHSMNSALVYISYPTHLVISNLRLLVIYIVGILFSRSAQGKRKLQFSKLKIGCLITLGIFLFNHNGMKKNAGQDDSAWGFVLLLIGLLSEGFLVDSQSFVKKQYNPSSNDLFGSTNKVTFVLSFVGALLSNELVPIFNFAVEHQGFYRDMALLCCFGTAGQFFVYELIKRFRPHIYALLKVTRKVATLAVSIFIYKHSTDLIQIAGMIIVFIGLFYQMLSEFKGFKQEKKA